jgi:hypothetical protein
LKYRITNISKAFLSPEPPLLLPAGQSDHRNFTEIPKRYQELRDQGLLEITAVGDKAEEIIVTPAPAVTPVIPQQETHSQVERFIIHEEKPLTDLHHLNKEKEVPEVTPIVPVLLPPSLEPKVEIKVVEPVKADPNVFDLDAFVEDPLSTKVFPPKAEFKEMLINRNRKHLIKVGNILGIAKVFTMGKPELAQNISDKLIIDN